MPIQRFYPTAIHTNGGNFSNPNNVIGNTTSSATKAGATTAYHTYSFNLASIPAGGVVNKVTVGQISRISAADAGFVWNGCILYTNDGVNSLEASLPITDTWGGRTATTALATYTASAPNAATSVSIPSTMTTTDKLRVGTYGVQLQWNRISGNTSRTWTWQKLWIEIDYTIPQSVSVLFVGELF